MESSIKKTGHVFFQFTVADLGFPEGALTPDGSNITFAENCMKMKLRGGARDCAP